MRRDGQERIEASSDAEKEWNEFVRQFSYDSMSRVDGKMVIYQATFRSLCPLPGSLRIVNRARILCKQAITSNEKKWQW